MENDSPNCLQLEDLSLQVERAYGATVMNVEISPK